MRRLVIPLLAALGLILGTAVPAQASDTYMNRTRGNSAYSLAGGSKIVVRSPGGGIGTCTVGAPYVRKGVTGFITAGHCAAGSKLSVTRVRSANNSVGVFKYRSWATQRPDVSFVDTYSSVSVRRKVYDRSLSSRHVLPLAGSYRPRVSSTRNVCLAGARYGTICGYRVVSYDADGVVTQGKRIKPLWIARRPGRCLNGPGDSGGPLYTVIGGKAYFMGLQSLMYNDQSAGCYILFTGVLTVNARLGGAVPGVMK